MNGGGSPYALGTRIKALEAGIWISRDGALNRLATMPGPHLVNALLAALVAQEPASVTSPLALAVAERGLFGDAFREAERRESQNRSYPQNRAQKCASKVNSESQNRPVMSIT